MNGETTRDGEAIDAGRRMLVLGAAGASLGQLSGCGGGGASSAIDPANPPALINPADGSSVERPLPLIALDQGLADGSGGRQFSLVVQRGSSNFLSGVSTPTLGYNGALLGPALRLRTGERTTIRVHNTLDEITTTHWHGLVVPADVDGGPHQSISPGASWDANFTLTNAASTCWFHPHVHGATGRQVVSGLAGLLIVDDAAIAPATLPDTWGVDDLALVLQDKRFTASGQIDYALDAADRFAGYTGDRLLVNGVLGPTWRAPRQWVRFRLLNGCNARFIALRTSDGQPMLQVANEGGLLAAPVTRSTMTLAPGERAEFLVDFSGFTSGQESRLLARSVNGGMGMVGGMGGAPQTEVTALTIRVDLPRQAGAMAAPPAMLPAQPPLAAGAAATVRSFRLDGGMMGGSFTINGRGFDPGRIDLAVPADTVEVWRFTNATGMAHPMHVHGVRMSLISRDGAPPAAYEAGTRDTFIVEAMQTVSVAVRTPRSATSVPLVFHCHILEHEDAGMMGQFVTV